MTSTAIEREMEKEYEKALEDFCDHGDVGDEWCGEDVIQAILTWIKSNIEFDDTILDIGCGNANLLFQLYHAGFTKLTGIDKSPSAIKLATQVSQEECVKIPLEVCDVLGDISSSEEGSPLKKKYKLILDKGLFDTLSTNVKNTDEFRDKYLTNTSQLLNPGGILMVATCCHTEEELKSYLSKGYNVLSVLPTPVLEFGGKKGHNVTVVAFQKKDS